MRFFSIIVFILFNIYLIESANRTESENSDGGFESENSEKVPGGAEEKSDKVEDVIYEEYEYDDGENSISEKSGKGRENSTEEEDAFPNEVFLSLRNITADAATAFRSFTNRNDVVDLQASASDNLNVSTNSSFGDAEAAGINLRALRDAGHPPQIIEVSEPLHLPYKHTKIDTADLSDCALQGEWKPMGVAHGHLHVGDGDSSHQTEILQSVGSYAVPNKVIPHWQQTLTGSQDIQDGAYNHNPLGLYAESTGGSAFGSSYSSGVSSGFVENGNGNGGVHSAPNHHHGFSGGLTHQKIKSASMLSPPPIPPIILGKKPGYWKLPKTKHKFFPPKGRRPSFGFSGQLSHGGGSGYLYHAGGGHGGGGFLISGGSGHNVGGSGVFGHVKGGAGAGGPGGGSVHIGHGFGGSGGAGGPGGGSIHGGHGFGGSGGAGEGSVHGGYGFGSSGGAGGGSIHGGHGFGGSVGAAGGSVHGGYGFGSSGGSEGAGGAGGGSVHGGHGFGGSGHGFGGGAGVSSYGFGGDGGSLSLSEGHGSVGGATVGHLIADSSHGAGVEEELSSGSHAHGGSSGYGSSNGGHSLSGALGSGGGDGQSAILVHSSGSGVSGGHLVTLNHGAGGDTLLPEASFLTTGLHKPTAGSHYQDSTFSSTHISQGVGGGGNSLPDASFLSSHINQDFAVHGQGISDDLSSSSTFTCGKNHDHNTNYHTATFQVADHDHPSSVDVLQYGGDAAVLIKSGDASFHDQLLPERKHYKAVHLPDAEASGSDNANELTSQAAQLTSQPAEQEAGQTEAEPNKTDDGEEPERHSYYHEITKVTKIPATSVGSVEYTFSKYETKPQTFSTESETPQEEHEVEQPQIIRELEHLSNKFQLDIENPQKLFEDPPTQELAYHYPFQDGEHHQEIQEGGKEEGHEGITEFPYQFYHNPNKVTQYPVVIHKKPVVKYIPRPGKPQFYQKTTVNYLQPKPPLVVLRKHKPKQFLTKKQNYEVHEHGGERHRPIGEIFPPQKFPKQFHNPKPNFAVDRPKNGWRPDVYQEYKYNHSHGKKVKKFKTKGKVVAPILIRRPVSPAPVIRVVEVSG